MLFHVDVRTDVDVLSIVARSALDLANRRIDLLNGDVFAGVNSSVAGLVRQKPARGAQIRERMLIEWVPARYFLRRSRHYSCAHQYHQGQQANVFRES